LWGQQTAQKPRLLRGLFVFREKNSLQCQKSVKMKSNLPTRMPPDNKQIPTENPADTKAVGSVPPPQGALHQSTEPRYLSFENVLAQKGRETPEDLKAGIRLLRTFQSDVAEAMRGENGSLTKMALAENERKDKEREEVTKRLLQEKPHAIPQGDMGQASTNQPSPISTVDEGGEKTITTPESRSTDSLATTLGMKSSPERTPLHTNLSAESRINELSSQTQTEPPSARFSGRIGSSSVEVRKKHIVLPLVLSFFFFIVGIGALYLVYTKSTTTAPAITDTTTPISFSDYQNKVLTDGFTRNQLLASINSLKSSTVYTYGSLLNIVLVETDPVLTKDGKKKDRLIETSGLFSLLQTRASASFIRSLDPQFVLGLHVVNGGEPFLILKTSFYDSTFSGMLDWEKSIAPDLLGIFTKAKAGTSTDILGEKVGDWNDAFEDKVVKNKDTRILRDSHGNTVLLYSFINKETLIITTNEATFNEIYDRLTVSSFKR
jgi:hypothetical protein